MTSRERFLRTLAGEPVDRPPLWEEGIREDVLAAWVEQGAPLDSLRQEFDYDHRILIQPDISTPRFYVTPASKADDLPADTPERYPDNWSDLVKTCKDRDFPVGLRISRGLLLTLGVGEWRTLAPVLFACADEPERVAALMNDAARFAVSVLQRAFDEIVFDYVVFSEPIASNAGPVVGPWTFCAVCGDAYRRLVDCVRERDIKWIIFQTYGDARPLLPEALNIGCDVMWIGEQANTGIDYRRLRDSIGIDVGLIGGLENGLLLDDPGEMERTLRRIVPPLIAQGRYLPLLDGRVRDYVPFESYRTYRRTLLDIVADTCG